MIEFVWWGFLLLLPLAFILRAILQPADHSDDFALRTPYYQNWLQLYENSETNKEKRLLRFILLILIWIFLVLAVARPQYVGEPIELPATGRDLLLAVDISGSMKEMGKIHLQWNLCRFIRELDSMNSIFQSDTDFRIFQWNSKIF